MINQDVVLLLKEIHDRIDDKTNIGTYIANVNYNEGIFDALKIIDEYIDQFSKTPNDIKAELGVYHN